MLSPADSRILEQVRRNLIALSVETALLRLHLAAKAGFDPTQPRIPRGRPGGGRWTRVGAPAPQSTAGPTRATADSGNGADREPRQAALRGEGGQETWGTATTTRRADGSIAEQNVISRDGTRVRSEFGSLAAGDSFDDRHTVTGPDGASLIFANTGADQLIQDGAGGLLVHASWRPGGPHTEIYRPDLLGTDPVDGGGTIALLPLLSLGLALYDWLTRSDDDAQHTVASFSAREYARGAETAFMLDSVRRLERDEVEDYCPRFGEVQARTDRAVAEVRQRGETLTPQTFGTAVHVHVKNQVDALDDPDFRAEVSMLKSSAIDEQISRPDRFEPRYGQHDSIRIDVLDNFKSGTVCVYDIKTGPQQRLGKGRSEELANAVLRRFPDTKRIIVIEVKPTR